MQFSELSASNTHGGGGSTLPAGRASSWLTIAAVAIIQVLVAGALVVLAASFLAQIA